MDYQLKLILEDILKENFADLTELAQSNNLDPECSLLLKKINDKYESLANLLEHAIEGNYSSEILQPTQNEHLSSGIFKALQKLQSKVHLTKILKKLQGLKTIEEFGETFIKKLAEAVDAQIGSFYTPVYSDEKQEPTHLMAIGQYGISNEKIKKTIAYGSGITGQCAKDHQERYLTNLPKDFLIIDTGIGKCSPNSMVAFPIVYDGKLYAVFELVFLNEITETNKKFINLAVESVGLSIQNIFQNTLTKKLYDEIAEKNNSLATQKQALDSSAIVVETDLRGRITYVNDKFLEISKYERSELLGKDHRILNSGFHPKDFFKELWHKIAKGDVWKGEVKNKAKDGTFYWVDTTIYPVKNEDGTLQKYIAIRFDITSRKAAEEKLSAASASLISQKQALDSAAIVAETDIRGKITYVNDKLIHLSKYSKEELLGQDHRILNSGHHSKEFFNTLWSTIKSGKVWSGQVKNKAKDGGHYWVDTTIYPVKDENGNLIKFVAIRFDITERMQIEEELINATKEAQLATEVKSNFLANMSHEIRTPLNGIISCAHLLHHQSADSENEKLSETIVHCGDSLLTIVNDILDFSKIESEKMTLLKQPFHLEQTVSQIVQLFKSGNQNPNTTLTYKIEDNVPDFVIADETRVRQVLSNLINNALKFTPQGTVKVHIKNASQGKTAEMLHISVQDQGIGLSKSEGQKLFQPFTQVDASTAKKFGGTGLGLAICRSLVTLMGGNIWVESEKGQGATFHFTFEAAPGDPVQYSPSIPDKEFFDANTAMIYPLNILVADDNNVNQMVGQKLLEKLGYQADIATGGEEVLQALKQKSYDLIFMDCNMPDIDGFETTRIVHETYAEQSPAIVALTASSTKEDIAKCYDAGMDDFVSKPISIVEIIRVIKKVYRDQQQGQCHAHKSKERSARVFCESNLLSQFKGDGHLLRAVVNEFLPKVEVYLSEIQNALEINDQAMAKKKIHRFKGAVSNFHSQVINDEITVLSEKVENLSFENAMQIFKKLQNQTLILKEQLQTYDFEKSA